MRTALSAVVILVLAAAATAEEPMRILTYPTGLVVGELEVKVDLGPEVESADLFLDGEPVCSMTPAKSSCSVDLGADPHVHLLELVRKDGAAPPEGGEGNRVERWVNRPGQEAELSVVPLPPAESGNCQARIGWAHPDRQDPAELELIGAEISADGRTATFPCPASGRSRMLVAMAVFPDGRRVEEVAVVGGFSERTAVQLHAVPLVATPPAECRKSAGVWPASAAKLEESGFEVVFVLDPQVGYRTLYTSGWDTGRLRTQSGNASGTTKAFDEIVRSGAEDSAPKPKSSWLKAKQSIFDVDRLWYVAPDPGLHRVNGLGEGRPSWLNVLFKYGLVRVQDKPRIADAVAASGLVAGAGPRRRAVVLLLGNNVQKRDGSKFTPAQAREYLAEVNVPLVVLRNGRRQDDGWPEGLTTLDMEALSENLRTVRDVLDAQCIAWFSSRLRPSLLARALGEGVRLAGRGGAAPASPESVWARAEIEMVEPLPTEEPTAGEPVAEGLTVERLDITAVTVLVSARGEDGLPVSDLTAADFRVLEDGTEARVLGLNTVVPASPEGVEPIEEPSAVPAPESEDPPGARELPIAVYVNRTVGGGFDQRQALKAVATEIERLASLGPVEVVIAEKEQVRTLIGPTRDTAALVSAVDELAAGRPGFHAIERIRRRFIQEVRQIPDRFTRAELEESEGPAVIEGARVTFAARAAAGEENVLVSRSLEQLGFWARRESGHQAGLLLVVGGGFDEDPAAFYQPFIEKLEPHNASQLREHLRALRKESDVNALGRELAGTGWRILSVAGQTTGSSTFSADARTDKFLTFMTDGTEGIRAADPSWLLIDPIDAQRALAEPSGGDVAVGPAGLGRALEESTGWYLLTYQVTRPPDGEVHDLELRLNRPGVEVKTSKLVTAATSEGQAEARLKRLLGGSADRGELRLELAIGPAAPGEEGTLTAEVEATLHFGSLAPLMRPGTALRVSVASAAGDGDPSIVHERERLAEASAGWIYTFPVQWPSDAPARLAVTVEELASGLWGSAVSDLTDGR
ncbi:MAG: hypothetical protein GY719_02200 [bacterium]|nr:hypothetical protein [bacterium]